MSPTTAALWLFPAFLLKGVALVLAGLGFLGLILLLLALRDAHDVGQEIDEEFSDQ